ncbi:hypothetical protein [Staphylococcus cornubiensis]|uniref:hypothetical protein n=1 Tax=Staphylococcus cornubiensis TaxID=1986155 RepID=UPI000A386D50|nr:hypothetical protein [Staphylococcus cornubiensis]
MNFSFNYYKFVLLNHIRRKYEFLENKKYKKMYLYIMFLDVISTPVFVFILMAYLCDVFYTHINTIDYYFKLISFIYVSIFSVIGNINELIFPTDKKILFKSPNSNRDIYNKVFLLNLIKRFQGIFNVFIIAITISIYSTNMFVYLFNFIIIIFMEVYLSYIGGALITKFKVSGMKSLININYFLFNIVSGVFFSMVSFFLVSFFIKIIIKPLTFIMSHNLKVKTNFTWSQLFNQIGDEIYQLHVSLTHILSYFSPHLGLENFPIFLIWVIVSSIIHISMILSRSMGFWYRENYYLTETAPCLNLIKHMKESLTKVQALNFLKNVEQLTLHKPYIYISYSLWIYSGVLLACNKHLDNQISMFVTIIVIYMMSRDANTLGTDFFTNSLRFDSEKYSIALYRMANISFLELYNSKIKIIRFLAIKESVLIIIFSVIVSDFHVLEIILTLLIVLLNFLTFPHLSLIPSFISPHFQSQHFNELDDLGEDEILEENVISKFNSILTSVYIYGFLISYFLRINFKWLLLFDIIFTSVFFVISFLSIKKYFINSKKSGKEEIYIYNTKLINIYIYSQ